MAEGPAMAGMASGTISGSPSNSGTCDGGGGKIMRKAIRNITTPPATCSDRPLRLSTRRKPSPRNMKVSNTPNAMLISRRITRERRSGATFFSALAKIGMLPNGSVISSNRMVAETKV